MAAASSDMAAVNTLSHQKSAAESYTGSKGLHQHETETADKYQEKSAVQHPYAPSSTTAEAEDVDVQLPNGAIKEPDGDIVTFPDGGLRAWLVVAGSAHILFCTFGFVVSDY